MGHSNIPWNHQYIQANGIRIHYVRHGKGLPIFLLHGWPEFWFVYRKNILPLAESFDVIVPDLRGFGQTEKPVLPDPPSRLVQTLVDDLHALADGLGLKQFGIVSHDVAANIVQVYARQHPERIQGLFFFNCPYPGIGKRWAEADTLNEIWYQSFHQQPWAAKLVGYNRDTCRIYFSNMIRHWCHRPDTFDEDLEAWVDNFMAPGNLQGGFNWYIGINAIRLELIRKGPPTLPRVEIPARFFGGVHDPVIKIEWADRLGDYFENYTIRRADGAGHFVQYEQAEPANQEILHFFLNLR